MKYGGAECRGDYCRRVELPRGDGSVWSLAVSPLPLAFHRRLRERGIVAPRRPTRVARDSSGKPLRDQQGLAVLVPDAESAEYLAALDLYNQRVAALVLVEGLRGDESLQFETPVPGDNGDWLRYADGICEELERAGWSAGDVGLLCEHVFRVSNLLDEHVRDTAGNFSPAAGAT